MPTRLLDGVNDVISFDPPPYFAGTCTVLAVVKRASTSGFQGIFTIGTPSDPEFVFEFTPDGIEAVSVDGNFHSQHDSAIWAITDWQLVGVSISPGGGSTFAARFHQFDGTTWVHAASNDGTNIDTLPDWTAVSGTEARVGNWNTAFNFFSGNVAIVGVVIGTTLADIDVEALGGVTVDDWSAALGHVLPFTQEDIGTAITDLVGDMDQISIVGTTVVEDVPPETIIAFEEPPPPPPPDLQLHPFVASAYDLLGNAQEGALVEIQEYITNAPAQAWAEYDDEDPISDPELFATNSSGLFVCWLGAGLYRFRTILDTHISDWEPFELQDSVTEGPYSPVARDNLVAFAVWDGADWTFNDVPITARPEFTGKILWTGGDASTDDPAAMMEVGDIWYPASE